MLISILVLSFAATLGGGAAPVIDRVVARAGLWRVQAFRSGILIAVAFGDVLPEAWRAILSANSLASEPPVEKKA